MAGAIKSTGRKDYTTPEWIVEAVRGFFWSINAAGPNGYEAGIDLDPCSNPKSIVNAARNVMLEDSSLEFERRIFGADDYTVVGSWRCRNERGNGLAISWDGLRVYVNPPFGYDKHTKIGVSHWIQKGYDASLRGANVILCIPDTPETEPWKNIVLLKSQGRCQLKTRVKFGGMKQGIPKPISLIYFGSQPDLFRQHFQYLGRVENPSEVYANQAGILL